jgi:hypothetical protein
MKKIILTLFLATLLIASVSANGISFSPGSLRYTMSVGETQCKKIYFNTNTEKASLEDYWLLPTQTEYKDWYLLITGTTGITRQESISQVTNSFNELTSGKSTEQICITANEKGTFRGILFVQGLSQEGNQVVRGGIWILVKVI